MSKKLLFNFNREVIQNYTYVEYVGAIITATNTLEKPIKRAILKGNTLVNVVSSYWFSGRKNTFSVNLKQYKIGQSYIFIMFDAPSNTTEIYLGDANGSIMWSNYTNNFTRNKNSVMLKVTCPSNYDGSTILPHLRYLNNELPSSIDNIKCMLIEYQQDMESWYIPYFEGMQSVKMPILKTSNEDDTKTNILTVNEDVTLRSNGDICDELNLLTGQLTQRIGEDGVVLSQEVVKTLDLSILDQNGNKVSSISSFNDTTHIKASSETIPPIFKGYLATKEVE